MASLFEDEKNLLPEVVRLWQEMNKEQHILVLGYAAGVTAVTHKSESDDR